MSGDALVAVRLREDLRPCELALAFLIAERTPGRDPVAMHS